MNQDDDAAKVQEAFALNGWEITVSQAGWMWQQRSAIDHAMWLRLPDTPEQIYGMFGPRQLIEMLILVFEQ